MAALPEINHDTLAGRLGYGLIYRGISAGTLSSRAGYTGATTTRRYLNGGVANPSIEIVCRLADALGCDRTWLLLGRGEPNWDPDWKR